MEQAIIKDLKPKSELEVKQAELDKEKKIVEKHEKELEAMQTKGQELSLGIQTKLGPLQKKAEEVAQQAYKNFLDKHVKEENDELAKIANKIEKKRQKLMDANKRKYDLQILVNYLNSKKIYV